jgi:hypothetical protein
MKKKILLIGLVPVLCGAIGFGAGTVLKPEPGIAATAAPAHPGETTAEEVLERLATEAPQAPHAPEAHAPAPHANSGDDAQALPAPEAAKPGHGSGHAAVDPADSDKNVVTVGRISVPVYKASSVTYVIADFGVAVEDQDRVAYYSINENATRLRDAILTSMHRVAETPMLMGPAIDSDELADALATDLKPKFAGVKSVLFLSLHKTDVPRG